MPSSEKKKLASRRDFLVFLDENSRWTSPGKLTHNFYAHYSQCSTKRSLQKLMDNFLAEGWKSWFKSTSLPLLPSLSLISHRMQLCCHPQRRKNSQAVVTSSFFVYEKSCWTSPGKLTHNFFCSLQPVQYQAFASKIDGQLSEIFFPLHRVSAQVLIFACWKTKAVCWKIRSKTKQKS